MVDMGPVYHGAADLTVSNLTMMYTKIDGIFRMQGALHDATHPFPLNLVVKTVNFDMVFCGKY